VSGDHRIRNPASGQAERPIDVRPSWRSLFPDDPDPVQVFSRLVSSRKTGDYRAGERLRLALVDLGWRVTPIEPRPGNGGRR
jgi:hypothetical protein